MDSTGLAEAMVVGLFRDRENAERAYRSLSERGYNRVSVNLIITDKARKLHFPANNVAACQSGALAAEGSDSGGTIGGLARSLAAADAVPAIGGLGIMCAGPIAATIVGACARGAADGLTGALIGSGIPEERAAECEHAVHNGAILLSVRPRSVADAEHFEREWKAYGADNVGR